MKKLTTVLSSAAILATALSSGSALAYTDDVMDPAESYDTAVKVRQVNYTCQSNLCTRQKKQKNLLKQRHNSNF